MTSFIERGSTSNRCKPPTSKPATEPTCKVSSAHCYPGDQVQCARGRVIHIRAIELILHKYPKRTDLWSDYLDQVSNFAFANCELLFLFCQLILNFIDNDDVL